MNTCIIVEDEPLARSLMEVYVSKVPQLKLLQSFGKPMEALEFLKKNAVDLLFTDIQMPELTGISLIKLLKNQPLVILTTAYSEYALEGYEMDVIDYLLKPITLERFLKAIDKALARLNIKSTDEPESIFVKDGTKLVKIDLNEILYIEGLKDYVAFVMPNKKTTTLQTMKGLDATLPKSRFVRVHNSFIVAFSAIDGIEKDRIIIGQKLIPISDSYKKSFKEAFENRF